MQDIDPQIASHKHRLQMDLLIKEGDLRKNEQKKIQLDVENRQTKRKIDLLNMDMEKNNKEMKRIESEKLAFEAEIKKLKKEILDM